LGIATGTLAISKFWPISRYCRVAAFPSFPAVGSADATIAARVLRSIEDHLRRRGVHEIGFASYESPLSGDVLPGLHYQLTHRSEYHFDLKLELDVLHRKMTQNRRNEIRRATKHGVRASKLVPHP
jgi:hypothetical protein